MPWSSSRATASSRAGPAGQVQIPAGAQVIDAKGKYVLPGLWDAQTNYSWFNGELNLNQGVTSIIDIGNGEEWSILHREGVDPRQDQGPADLYRHRPYGRRQSRRADRFRRIQSQHAVDPKTVEETVAVTKKLLDAGADMVMIHDGRNFTPEMVAASLLPRGACARQGVCTQRADGPKMTAKDAAIAGADQLPHARGIDLDVMKDGATRSRAQRAGALRPDGRRKSEGADRHIGARENIAGAGADP